MPNNERIDILGAGLVGSLLSILLSRKGFEVNVFEKRGDLRNILSGGGRSINLALSHRGIRALQMTEVYDDIRKDLIPMKGRMMHDTEGNLSSQPYGKEDQHINSVSRSGLNKALISHAEDAGSVFHFDHKCEKVNFRETLATYTTEQGKINRTSDVLIGADGAFSAMRKSMQKQDRFNLQQYYIEHGYKELTIGPRDGDFALEPNYLHIWPRGNFMLIALPNPDHSFTCTLFFPFEGKHSFSTLKTDHEITGFFETFFRDLIPIMPDFLSQYHSNQTSSLVTIKTSPWIKNRCILIGDASHAIVPFYGQGMNAGFEDCRLFMEWGERLNFDWGQSLPYFFENRKKDTDAIADLAMKNFVEMRDKVASQRFLDIKKLEARLQAKFDQEWLPLYSMVTFTDIPYSTALTVGQLQEKIMSELPLGFDPEEVDLDEIMKEFNTVKKAAL